MRRKGRDLQNKLELKKLAKWIVAAILGYLILEGYGVAIVALCWLLWG